MPAIRHSSKRKAPPEGFSDIETDLLIFSNKMKDAENAPSTNVPRHAAMWPIFQISHQRSRYVYELYYEKEAISTELYEWLLKNGYADAQLIAKWKKEGYEKVCCSYYFLNLEDFVLRRGNELMKLILGMGAN
jgi:bud site selection protein 31